MTSAEFFTRVGLRGEPLAAPEAVVVDRNVLVRLGDGTNTFSHEGEISGNLLVTSKNEDDTATVADTAIVGGETRIALGEQRDFRHPFGRGPRFGFQAFGPPPRR